MDQIFHPGKKCATNAAGSRPKLVFISRVLLLSTGLLTLLMPFTEYLWGWGRFLRGGHDFEFGFLGILVAIGLVVGIAHQIAASTPFSRMAGDGVKTPPTLFRTSCASLFGVAIRRFQDGAENQARIALSLCLPITPLRI